MRTTKSAFNLILTGSFAIFFGFGGGRAMAGADLDRLFSDLYYDHYEEGRCGN